MFENTACVLGGLYSEYFTMKKYVWSWVNRFRLWFAKQKGKYNVINLIYWWIGIWFILLKSGPAYSLCNIQWTIVLEMSPSGN